MQHTSTCKPRMHYRNNMQFVLNASEIKYTSSQFSHLCTKDEHKWNYFSGDDSILMLLQQKTINIQFTDHMNHD